MASHWDDSIGPDVNLTPPVDKKKLSATRKRLYERVEHINRAWLESMREMRRAEAEFSIRLFSCITPEGALEICNQWLARRTEIIETERNAFNKAWPDLLEVVANPKALKGHARIAQDGDTDS